MKDKIKQNLNQERETKILDFDGGNGSSIPILIEIAREHSAPLDVTIYDRKSTDIAEQLLIDNDFKRKGNTFTKNSLRFNIEPASTDFFRFLRGKEFDLSMSLDGSISAIPSQETRHDIIGALSIVSNRLVLTFVADDYYMDDVTLGRSRGLDRGEILLNGLNGMKSCGNDERAVTCGVYDEGQVKNILTAYGAQDIEVFRQDQHPMLAIFTCLASCFKTKMLGVVAKGKAVKLAGEVVNQITR